MYFVMNFGGNDLDVAEIIYGSSIGNRINMMKIEAVSENAGIGEILNGNKRCIARAHLI